MFLKIISYETCFFKEKKSRQLIFSKLKIFGANSLYEIEGKFYSFERV